MLTIKTTKRFTKSLKILVRIPKKRAKIQHVIQQLQEHSKLEAQHKDHKLVGNFNGCRECHIEFDLLLIYKIEGKFLLLIDIGTHSELF
jgi:mRNA interferase YafQ